MSVGQNNSQRPRVGSGGFISQPQPSAVSTQVLNEQQAPSVGLRSTAVRSNFVSAFVCSAVLIAYAIVILIANGWRGRMVDVDVTLDLEMGFSCSEVDSSRYSDLPNGLALVVDGKGNMLGEGRLDQGTQKGLACTYRSEFMIEEAPDGVYRVQLGDPDRGFFNYLEEDVSSDRLVVDLMCCVADSDGGAAIPADGCARRDDDNDGVADSQGIC
jgi:hypothetical protein